MVGGNPSFYYLNLKDKRIPIRYTFKSLLRLQQEVGKPLADILQDERIEKLDFDFLVKIIWAGLLDWKPDITPEEVVDLVSESEESVYEVMRDFISALTAQLDSNAEAKKNTVIKELKIEQKEKVEKTVPAGGTGSDSSSTPI